MPDEKEGLLEKKGGVRRNWLQRQFCLKEGQLTYSEPKSGKQKGAIATQHITSCSVKPDDAKAGKKSGKEHVLQVETAQRVYFFAAQSDAEMESWVSAISSWIGHDDAVVRERKNTYDLEAGDDEAAAVSDGDRCVISRDGVKAFVERNKFQRIAFDKLAEQAGDAKELDKESFAALTAPLFELEDAERRALSDALFEYLDLDESGAIDACETLCALNLLAGGAPGEKARACFKAFDKDSSGTLDRQEFAEMLRVTLVDSRALLEELMGAFLDDAQAAELETAVDAAKGGEHAALIQLSKLGESAAASLADECFYKCDADDSGEVDLNEFVQFVEGAKMPALTEFFKTNELVFGKA